jgi:endonuclease/exonuclease/phosphatase family metal-dependent hydrolase
VTAPGRAVAVLVAASGLCCASARNYLEPGGPLYVVPRAAHRNGAAPEQGLSSSPFRVVTFNIAYALEIDRAIRVLQDSPPLRDADVVALQEMDAPGTERIARALAMNSVYFPSGVHPKYERDFGCALLSPWPLTAPYKILLPHGARVSGLRRAATCATVVRGDQSVLACSVHLPSPLAISGGARKGQLRLLADGVRGRSPVVIAGDFNSHDKVFELEKGGFSWLTRDVGATTRFRLLGIPLAGLSYDHVLARGLRLADGPDTVGVVSDNRGASDHRPVFALLVPETGARSAADVP